MAIPEKTFTSALPELMASLFGTKGSTKTTSTANTGPLQAVVDAAMKPMDQQLYEALVASIAGTAAQQVPSLTAALANATGGRTTGNTPLALALNEQNNKAMADAAAAIMGYNQRQLEIAGNAAGGIAQATRSTNQQTTAGKPGINPLLMTAGGWLLNKADKKGMFDFMKDTPDAPVTLPSVDFGSAMMDLGGGNTLLSGGGGTFTDSTAFAGAAPFDIFSGFDFSNLGNSFDFGSSFDFGAPALDEIWNNMDFSFFADGGTVGRNRVNMGDAPVQQGTAAMTATPEQLAQLLLMAAQSQQMQTPQQDVLEDSAQVGADKPATDAENDRIDQAVARDAQTGYAGRSNALMGLALTAMGMAMPALAAPISVAQTAGVAPRNPLSLGNAMQSAFQSVLAGGDRGTTGYAAIDSAQFGTADAPAFGGSTAGESGFGTGVPMADGGTVRGTGTGTSDSIPAKNKTPGGKPIAVSNGEHIIPADVVAFYGEDFFRRLSEAVHTPVRR